MKGSGYSVVQELRGERIDIIPWSQDHKICAAPWRQQRFPGVYIDEENRHMKWSPDDQSLAIGKKARMFGWHPN
jgi:N utilization substance protein A